MKYYCEKCGKELNEEDMFCAFCGAKNKEAAIKPENNYKRNIAIIVAPIIIMIILIIATNTSLEEALFSKELIPSILFLVAFYVLAFCFTSSKDWIKKNKKNYDNYVKIYNERLAYFKKNGFYYNNRHYLVNQQMKLNWLELCWSIEKCREKNCFEVEEYVSKSSIKYYTIKGSIHTEHEVSRSNYSKKGFVVGSLIGGDAGAIIGSNQKYKIVDKEVDDRVLVVVFKDNTTMKFPFSCIYYFRSVMPNKEALNYKN